MRKVDDPATRQRNPRGQGTRLREEIIAGATEILERTGAEESVTLRSVAREIGIAAPSIYAHFPDREAILLAVVDAAFDDLRAALAEAVDPRAEPVARLLAGCRAYVRFAVSRPGRYRVLFGRTRAAGAPELRPGRLDVFQILVDSIAACAAAGGSASTDPFTDAIALWSAMHGTVMLRAAAESFPWPPLEPSTDELVQRLARLT
ncbi:MAG TPA: TetR/AcrR family transcriptional regulator [Rugosimonospora sp.]|nr:TetR/AcrR family transcriptional regulator [Rugosimonospora sp.]